METGDELKRKSKRGFLEAWLSDERFKSWIRKVPFDNSLFHCVICNKNFSCSSLSHISRHAESAHHKGNIGKDPSERDNENSKRKPFRKKAFRQQWLEIEQFRSWLREVQHNSNMFFCIFCDKAVSGGLSQIYRHGESKIHKENAEKYDGEPSELNKGLDQPIDETYLRFEERKKSAEIRYAALIADKNIPHETAKELLDFFKDVGKEPNVLKCMSMGRTKCTNIITNVLCPVETDRLVKNINQNPRFSVFIDETSDISNEKRRMFHFFVRYINPETFEVHSQLVKLIDIDVTECNAEKLFNEFKHEMSKLQIPLSNIVSLLCDDNAPIITGKHFKKRLEEMCENVLILSCPCQSVALIAHVACAKIPNVCEDFLKKVAKYIKSNVKPSHTRSATFRDFCECFREKNHAILKLSETRWLSHHACVEKLLEFWDSIKHILEEIIMVEKTKNGENLLYVMQNVDIKAYLLFLKYILRFFNEFNTFFNVVETRIHLLQPKSLDFLTEICKKFLKPEILKDLPNVTFRKVENYKALDDITLGKECEEYLCQLMTDGYTNVVSTIRKNCLQFYVTAAEEIYKKLPVNDIFLKKLKVLLPHVALLNTDRKTSYNDLSFIAATIGGFDKIGLKKEWFALNVDFTITEKKNLLQLNFDDMWKQILQSRYPNNEIKYPHLTTLLNSIRSMPNSNADPERIYSFLSNVKTKKRNKLSSAAVNAICVLQSALETRGETVLNMKINTDHFSLMSSDKLYANVHKKKEGQKRQLHAADDDEDDEDDDDDDDDDDDNDDDDIAGPSNNNTQ